MKHLPSDEEAEKSTTEKTDATASNIVQALVTNTSFEEDEDDEPTETEELMAKGSVKSSLYWKYFRTGGSYFMLFLLVLFFALAQISSSGCDYWVGYW